MLIGLSVCNHVHTTNSKMYPIIYLTCKKNLEYTKDFVKRKKGIKVIFFFGFKIHYKGNWFNVIGL